MNQRMASKNEQLLSWSQAALTLYTLTLILQITKKINDSRDLTFILDQIEFYIMSPSITARSNEVNERFQTSQIKQNTSRTNAAETIH